MSTPVATMTADELWRLPDDGHRHELVEGRFTMMPPPGARHGRVALNVGALLHAHARATETGVAFAAETGFLIRRDPDTVRAPDAAFVARQRAEAVGDPERYWPGAPDFAAEVVSPADSFAEVEAKALGWLDAGTKLVLVVDPERRTATAYRSSDDVHVHSGDDTLDLSDAVPGWRLALPELFR